MPGQDVAARPADRPLVSVVIPSYSHEEYISGCIGSVIAQTYPNLELIVVDDSSSDGTFEAAQAAASAGRSRFRNIRVVRNEENQGAHASLNRGASLSTGRHIAFLNSDDLFEPNRIALVVEQMERRSSRLAFTEIETVGPTGIPYYGESLCHSLRYAALLAEATLPSLSWGFVNSQLSGSTGNLVVERGLFESVGGFRDYRYCHDWDFFLRAICLEEPIVVRGTRYRYRIHPSNTYKTLSSRAEAETDAVLEHFVREIMVRPPLNQQAPSPSNWPSLFLPLAELLGLGAHLRRVFNPYTPQMRIVDRTAATGRLPGSLREESRTVR